MQKLKRAVQLIGFMILAFFIIRPDYSFFPQKRRTAFAESISMSQNIHVRKGPNKSRAPHYVVVQMPLLKPLITGETGTFEISAHLKQNATIGSQSPRWNKNAATPLVIWLAAPENGEIEFFDKNFPQRLRRHIMIKFDPRFTTQPLTATVTYHVKKHTSAGKYQFWMEIYGHLCLEDGTEFQDMGAIRLPVQIDTHLNTKLLMLLVIAIAVLFFIMEWVRVDVVAIAMMVLLPELGLLNARGYLQGHQQQCGDGNYRGNDHQLWIKPVRPGQPIDSAAAQIGR